MQTMIPAVFDRKAFDATLRNMTDEDAAAFASANLGAFAGCFAIGSAPPAGPGPAKARPARTAPSIDMTALTSALVTALERFPRLRSEDYAAKVAPSDYHATAETIGAAVKRALERLVTTKAAYCEGKGRGRRYWLAPKASTEAAE